MRFAGRSKMFWCLAWMGMALLTLEGVSGSQSSAKKHDSPQQRLISDLFKNYDRDAKPMVRGNSSSVMVTFAAKLIRIIAVKERENTFRTQWWMQQRWTNPDLSWNASEYGGVSQIYVSPKRPWTPDILLYNSAEEDDRLGGGTEKYKTQIEIRSNGYNSWLSPAMFKSTCDVNTRYFPFDDQHCTLEFGSWAFDASQLDLQIDDGETGSQKFEKNTEWLLIKFEAKRKSVKYTCCPYPFPSVVLHVHIRRRYYYYLVNLVVPCSLIGVMVLLIFVLPPESGERIGLGITVLMAMAIFQELTSEKLPVESDHTPLLAQYYSGAIAEIGLALFATSIIINCHYRKTRMPFWIQKIVFNILGPIARIRHQPKSAQTDDSLLGKGANYEENSKDGVAFIKGNCELKALSLLRNDSNVSNEVPNSGECQVCKHLSNLRETQVLDDKEDGGHTGFHYGDDDENDGQHIYGKDWQMAAKILDRCTLIVAVIVSVCTFGAIFLQAPRIQAMFLGEGIES
ncbi:neuronal acetylcholine receptor subunit alpha-7 isoform X2 [Nematostella vectensis]|uniref:neuronal acetylcholine receptor subunit alpha-7 isoform X2 n=1 Tax=Nematostella vectensis TaxID=45351 RepID=UPI00139012BD|nr:neuronal acetylcholine receptor subunit alpha-7 isoform X2 [Nematostella vectensis]